MYHKPLVSLIVPVYNVEQYLEEALNSIINQTYRNIEIIVIDDGSKDESGLICNKYASQDNRIRLIHQANAGLSSARNSALEIVHGDYITYIDSDDAVDPSYVETMVNAIVHDDSDIVVCKFDEQHTEGEMFANPDVRAIPAVRSGKYDHSEILRLLFDGKINTAVFNKLYKRKIWKELRFPVGHVYEDVEIAYKTYDMCRSVTVIDDVLYHQRIRPGSITSTFSIKNVKDQMLAQSKIEAFVTANTPSVFPEKALDKLGRLHFEMLLKSYVRLSLVKGHNEEKSTLKKDLKTEILETGSNFKYHDLKKSSYMIYWTILNCPWVLDLTAPVSVGARTVKRTLTDGFNNVVDVAHSVIT